MKCRNIIFFDSVIVRIEEYSGKCLGDLQLPRTPQKSRIYPRDYSFQVEEVEILDI